MSAKLTGSVGRRGMNAPADVKLVQTLLERHSRWLTPLKRIEATGICDPLTIVGIEQFQARAMLLARPDGVVWPNGPTLKALSRPVIDEPLFKSEPAAAATAGKSKLLKPERGLLTFEAEGIEAPGNYFHSRVLHVPPGASGVTLGRGYDMAKKSTEKIQADLISAGVPETDAKVIAKAAGLTGAEARAFRDKYRSFSITQEAQVKLFDITYREEEAEVRRVSNAAENVAEFGQVDWINLHQSVLDVFVDLKFRGDWTKKTRKFCHKYLVDNDLKGLTECMNKSANWPSVPADRFRRRNEFLARAKIVG
jgi:hypothetical protein